MPACLPPCRPRRPTRGFTLIEVLVAMLIISILGAIAVPAYQDYVRRGRIPEATSRLAVLQVQMEQYYQDNRTYANANATGGPCATDSGSSRFFDFSCVGTPTSSGYTIRATGKGAMNGFTYSVDAANQRSSAVPSGSGWTGSTTCWVIRKGGVCS